MSTGHRPTRRVTVVAALALGSAGLAVGGASWATATTRDGLDAVVTVDVAGRAVAPGVTAGALVVVAAALALTLAGRWAAPLVGVVVVGGGALQTVSAFTVLGSGGGVERAARRAALEHVGVDALTQPPRIGPVPWLAVVVGLLTVALGVLVVLVGRRWAADRRHAVPVAVDATPTDESNDVPSSPDSSSPDDDDPAVWDRLSRGEDPT